jgi:hypothetical protein
VISSSINDGGSSGNGSNDSSNMMVVVVIVAVIILKAVATTVSSNRYAIMSVGRSAGVRLSSVHWHVFAPSAFCHVERASALEQGISRRWNGIWQKC